jgi:hypothetical protein
VQLRWGQALEQIAATAIARIVTGFLGCAGRCSNHLPEDTNRV